MVALMSTKKAVFLCTSAVLVLTLIGGALFGQVTQKNNVFRYLSIFTEVFDLVRNNYVEQVTTDQLLDGAFSGVTDAVDEFSYYVPPAQMAAYRTFSDVEDNGIGVIVTKRFGSTRRPSSDVITPPLSRSSAAVIASSTSPPALPRTSMITFFVPAVRACSSAATSSRRSMAARRRSSLCGRSAVFFEPEKQWPCRSCAAARRSATTSRYNRRIFIR